MNIKLRTIALFVMCTALGLVWPAPTAAQSEQPPHSMMHVVQAGETIFSIASRYGTTVDAITHANGIPDPRNIYTGQQLLIPSSLGPVDAWAAHIVRPGETFSAIASQYGVDVSRLALSNQLINPHLLYAGQVLHLPDPLDTSGALHAVQPGETLLGLAVHYGVPFQELVELNHDSTLVAPGQWVLIPGAQPAWMPLPFTDIDLSPVPVQQGEAMLVTVRTSQPVELTGSLFDRPLTFFEEGGAYRGVAGAHTFTEPGLYEMTLTATNGNGEPVSLNVGVVVVAEHNGYERIDVPPSRSNLLDPQLVAAENATIETVRNTLTAERGWHGPFQQPVDAAISSYFGTRRSYDGGPYTSYHSGLDFRIGQGAAVRAPADGTVVLAEPLAVRGNAIVVDHGWGVLTGYWHLSAFEVAVGQTVQQGQIIGRVGNTGLSTGAHLHWEVYAGGVSVNPLQWLAASYPWSTLDAGTAP
ncbi:MAG: LysM peptidoglycan-binding domain-containing protein [Anaerolineae bacterium]|nr:LysM peptidoglycan-binding domain-containing protein [Anaerolineae bacterium]